MSETPARIPDDGGADVIDRAVVAERRARRAETAESAQARIAESALKAVEALEARTRELEAQLEQARAAGVAEESRDISQQPQSPSAAGAPEETHPIRTEPQSPPAGERVPAAITTLPTQPTADPATDAELRALRERLNRAESRAGRLEEELAAARAQAADARAAAPVPAPDRTPSPAASAAPAPRPGASPVSSAKPASPDAATRRAEDRAERYRRALVQSLARLATLRAEAYDARLQVRLKDVVHAADAVRLAVLTAAYAGRDPELAATVARQARELEALHAEAADAARQLAAAREEATAAARDADRLRAEAAEELARLRAESAGEIEAVRREADASLGAAEQAQAEAEAVRLIGAADAVALAALREQSQRLTPRQPPQPGTPTQPTPEPARIAADLDAARAALRAGAEPPAAAPDPTPESGPTIITERAHPPRAVLEQAAREEYPWLRGAIVKLAHDDPQAAAAVLAALLPVQSTLIDEPLDYVLVLHGHGAWAVRVADGHTFVTPTREDQTGSLFTLRTDPTTLAQLVAGAQRHVGRFRGPARVKGDRSAFRRLQSAIQSANLSLTDAAHAGARLEPALVFRLFAYAIHPAWTRGHRFSVLQVVERDALLVRIADGAPVEVVPATPETPADATVTFSREAFEALLREEPVPAGERPAIRGDREAVELLRGWTDRARAAG